MTIHHFYSPPPPSPTKIKKIERAIETVASGDFENNGLLSAASPTNKNLFWQKASLKPGSYIVVIVVIIGNRKQVHANSERNLSQLLQLICSLYAWSCLRLLTYKILPVRPQYQGMQTGVPSRGRKNITHKNSPLSSVLLVTTLLSGLGPTVTAITLMR